MPNGTLFIVSAPSGAGKTTLCKLLVERISNLRFAVSHTTRAPRPGESDGADYYFVGRDAFKAMVETGDFLEWAEVHGNFYGTSKRELDRLLSAGFDVLHDIDVQGARQLREAEGLLPGAVFVFILPPSLEELERRLRGRGSETEEVIKRRLGNALGEIQAYFMYDYVIINDSLEEAAARFESVISAAGLRRDKLTPGWVERTFKISGGRAQ